MQRRLKIQGGSANVQKEIRRLAYTDYLTNLVNRRGLYLYYNELPKSQSMHFMFIDIDNFKRVNDVYGHSMGDKLLIEVSKLIRNKIPTGFVSRIGGDEFVVVISGSWTSEEVTAAAQTIIDDMHSMDFRKDILSLISLSVGIILEQDTSIMLDDILYKCDSAMYMAKSGGKNQFIVYRAQEKSVEIAKNIETEMEQALLNQNFHVYLQPKMNMITSKLVGAEALTRWMHAVDGLRMPELYIPLFEKNGFITKLDMYVYEKVCQIKASWRGFPYEHLIVSLNLSRLHLYKHDLPDVLTSIAAKYKVPTNELELEITEGVFIKDSNELIQMVTRLREAGFHVAIDDFGSGYSPLSMLKDLPVDIIKIDKAFLKLSTDNVRGQKVLKNVISMCKDIKLDIIAEGIETKEQIEFMTSCGCDTAQGFYYCDALPAGEFIKYAAKHYEPDCECVRFSFDNSLTSDCNKYRCCFVGDGFRYTNGATATQKAIYFPGGGTNKNVINIPSNVILKESYTISMWLKPTALHSWTSVFFAEFANGFLSFAPFAWEGNCSYRIRDTRIVDGWFDTPACRLWENAWVHVVISYNHLTEQTYLYINGILSGHLQNIPSLFSTKKVMLGGDIYQDSYQGYVADLMIFSDVKTPTEVVELFDSVHKDPTFDINA